MLFVWFLITCYSHKPTVFFFVASLDAPSYSLEIVWLPETGSLRKYKHFYINCNPLKEHLKNYLSPTCSLSPWAEISLCFLGFKYYRVSHSPLSNLLLYWEGFLPSCADKAAFWRIQDIWNISAGVVWNWACCEHYLQLFACRHPIESLFGRTKSHLWDVTGWIINWESKAWPHLCEWSCAN